MSARSKAKRKRKPSSTPFWTPEHRQEVVGLLLMALGVLLALAFITYNPADNALARTFSIDTFFHPRAVSAHNALGHIGAWLSYIFVGKLLGYTVLLWPLLAIIWGYQLFRHRQPEHVPLTLTLLLGGNWMLATLAGWLTLVWEWPLNLWSGSVGLSTAQWLRQLFGSAGSLLLLLSGIAAIARLFIDRDIQRTFDRVEQQVQRLFQRLKARWQAYRNRPRRKPAPKPRPTPAVEPVAAPAPPPVAQPAPPPVVVAPPPPSPPPVPDTPAPGEQLTLHVHTPVEEEKADLDRRSTPSTPVTTTVPYSFPSTELLNPPDDNEQRIDYEELEENKRILLEKLAIYNIEITHIDAIVGPTVTLYELTPTPGVKISRITALENDLAMALAAPGIRMIAPIPGKSAIGIEIPNRHRELVRISSILNTARFRDAGMELPVPLGKTIEGSIYLQDLTRMPHLLIAGATGSGKSVGLNALIVGLLYACHPANLKFVLIDPKKIELAPYGLIADHFMAMPEDAAEPIITDTTQALYVLKSCEKEMELRYELLKLAGVRGIKEYNQKLQRGKLSGEKFKHLPYIVVVIDELADLMLTAGKDIEGPIARLAQMARAVGIHLVLATQRPSVDVITGLIKANFPSRIAYQVASKVDSRTILDQNGAEQLVGNGDLLFMHGSQIIRLQGPFISVEEVERITEFIARQPGPGPYLLPSLISEEEDTLDLLTSGDRDELFEEAARIIVRSQHGSVSLLQRKLSIGYTRAARLIDQLEQAGIVGPFEGSKARQVLVHSEEDLESLLQGT